MFDLLGDAEKWEGAECASPWIDPDLFFNKYEIEGAKSICKGCPLINQCADYALENYIIEGVWGGLSEMERKQIWKSTRGKRSRKGIPNRKFWD